MLKVVGLVSLGILVILSLLSFEIVDTGSRGIKVRYGVIQGEPLPEGMHFKLPLVERIDEFSVRQDNLSGKESIFTKDTQNVVVEFSVLYNVDPAFVGWAFREYGDRQNIVDKVIKKIVLGSMKDAIGKVNADDLVGKREEIRHAAFKEVKENMAAFHVSVMDLQFTNLDFDDAYEQAVEQKVVALQDAQKSVNETVKIEEQAKQTVKTAQALATSMRIQSEALAQNKGLVEYEIAKKWNGVLPMYMMGSSVPLLNLNLTK